jgi:hypothetical protein
VDTAEGATMNLSMIGNVIAVQMVGVAVWLGMQWRPSPYQDETMMVAIALAFVSGVLTALSSQMTVTFRKPTRKEPTVEQKG